MITSHFLSQLNGLIDKVVIGLGMELMHGPRYTSAPQDGPMSSLCQVLYLSESQYGPIPLDDQLVTWWQVNYIEKIVSLFLQEKSFGYTVCQQFC